MYSSHLRRSARWASVTAQLADPQGLNLHESNINNADISIRFTVATPSPQQPFDQPGRAERPAQNSLPPPAQRSLSWTQQERHSSLPTKTLSSFPQPPSTTTATLSVLLLATPDLAPTAYAETVQRLEALASELTDPRRTITKDFPTSAEYKINLVVIFLLAPVTAPVTAKALTDRIAASSTHDSLETIDLTNGGVRDGTAAARKSSSKDPNVRAAISDYTNTEDTHSSPEMAYAQLQAALMAHKDKRLSRIVIRPIREVKHVTRVVQAHISALSDKYRRELEEAQKKELDVEKENAKTVIKTLLPYTTLTPPLSEHHTLLLTDLYTSLQDYASHMRTEEGRESLRQVFVEDGTSGLGGETPEEVARDVIDFWSEEWVWEG